ncbi:MAG: aminotransferase class III-fold pyridoxal phosphate-dependent enzyme [Mariniblastus sp.]
MEDVRNKPAFDSDEAQSIAWEHFGIEGIATELPGERDQNFKITTSDDLLSSHGFVLKIANPDTELNVLELENAAIQIAGSMDSMECSIECPTLIRSKAGSAVVSVQDANKRLCFVRCITFLPGKPFAKFAPHSPDLIREIGRALGELDRNLVELNNIPAAKRDLKWDLCNATVIVSKMIPMLANDTDSQSQSRSSFLARLLDNFQQVSGRVDSLRRSVIHNDANDYNVLVQKDESTDLALIGLIDFGDIVFSTTINDLAICGAYMMLDKQDPLSAATELVAGYHASNPLDEDELSSVFPLMCMRLAQSVCIAAEQQALQPDNKYLGITEKPAWEAIKRLVTIDPAAAHLRFSERCASSAGQSRRKIEPANATPESEIQTRRRKFVSPSLSLSYDRPLHIVRGRAQYLYDASDVTYLDCVNNVCHVGHCHPHVVAAAHAQMQQLNTNTRYLHENMVHYAERLVGTLPRSKSAPLEVCFFVNSGSEANDLALRLARNFTCGTDVAVLDHAYHGHTQSLIELSPYKFNHKGGEGKADHVHVLKAPDGYRGPFKTEDPECGKKYAKSANEVIAQTAADGKKIAAFFHESWLGCGGQVPMPSGFLSNVYKTIRDQGGVCIADEVQVGFGRVGSHFWGFEQSAVIPDIVTMGKPIGNGHPLAAVVTTREIADAFNNGMEYFNTFGGNPVSCAVGMAVLDVIEDEQLQRHAQEVGEWLLENLSSLKNKFDFVGDVRGSGLFLGIELVKDRNTLEPATELAHRVVQKMRQRRILLSTDGPLENVIKFKPPMVFSRGDAERLVMTLDETFAKV